MATLISTFAMVLAGHAAGEAQSAQRDERSSARVDARRDDRKTLPCSAELREYARRNDEVEQRLYRAHRDWHREHDRDTRDDAVRKHNELHARIDRTREQWERTPRPQRCAELRKGEAGRGEVEKKPNKRKPGN